MKTLRRGVVVCLRGGLPAAFLALLILVIPLFLVSTNVRWAVNEPRLYRYGFEKYEISRVMGMPLQELLRVGAEIREYFNSSRELLDVRVDGRPLYSEREVLHMWDVKGLVRGVYLVQWATGGFLFTVVLAMGGLAWQRRAVGVLLARGTLWGGTFTVGLLLLVGLAFTVAFNWLFYMFHIVSFRNPFWQLDPTRDALLRMFPEGFWFDAAMLVALATIVEALLLIVVGAAALRVLGKRKLARQGEAPETPRTQATGI